MLKNHHTIKNVYIGETKTNGQFRILKTFPQVVGEPFVTEPSSSKGQEEKLEAGIYSSAGLAPPSGIEPE